MKSKRAFILGAGFSKQADLPLATELTSLILDSEVLKDHDELQAWRADFEKRLRAAEGAGETAWRYLDRSGYWKVDASRDGHTILATAPTQGQAWALAVRMAGKGEL